MQQPTEDKPEMTVRAYSIEKAQENYVRMIARARKMPESMVVREAIDLYRESNESEATA